MELSGIIFQNKHNKRACWMGQF